MRPQVPRRRPRGESGDKCGCEVDVIIINYCDDEDLVAVWLDFGRRRRRLRLRLRLRRRRRRRVVCLLLFAK
jgi:hypothetical protein